MDELHLHQGFPAPETQPAVTPQPIEADPLVSRRALLRGGAAMFGAWALAGCSGNEAPANNANATASPLDGPVPEDTPYATSEATPYATEGSYPTEAAPSPSESSASPTPSASETATDRQKPEAVGYSLELKWNEQTNDKLASEIRGKGLKITGDPSMDGLDESYFPTATVIGLSAKAAKNRKLGVAVVATSPDGETSDKVYKASLPTSSVTKHGKTVAQLPAAVSTQSGQVHPYRFRRGSEELTVVFYTTKKNGKDFKVVDPVVINPKTNVNNGTYANAHII